MRTCVSNRDTDPPMQKLLHAVEGRATYYVPTTTRRVNKKIVRIGGAAVIRGQSGPGSKYRNKSVGISCTRFSKQFRIRIS
jgi:hypothetical protein